MQSPKIITQPDKPLPEHLSRHQQNNADRAAAELPHVGPVVERPDPVQFGRPVPATKGY